MNRNSLPQCPYCGMIDLDGRKTFGDYLANHRTAANVRCWQAADFVEAEHERKWQNAMRLDYAQQVEGREDL